MLTELLSLLKESRAWSVEDLADVLNIDVEAVKARLEFLEKTGLIHQVSVLCGCGRDCKSCSIDCGANNPNSFVMWETTK